MDFDFDSAQNTFIFLQENKKLSLKIEHKLGLLQDCINSSQIDTSIYNSLEIDECHSLMKLNKKAQMDMFMQIIQTYAVQNMLPCAIGLIEGEIDVRTKVLKNWKAKKFKIDSRMKTFEILRKKSSKKKPRIIHLQYYTVQPQEFKEKRYRFVITANSEGHGYYKTLVCGSDDKKLYDKVIEALKTISQFKDHFLRGSVLIPDANEYRQTLNQQSFMTQRSDMKSVTQSEIIPQKNPTNIVIKKQTQQSEIKVNTQSPLPPPQNSLSIIENEKQQQPMIQQQQQSQQPQQMQVQSLINQQQQQNIAQQQLLLLQQEQQKELQIQQQLKEQLQLEQQRLKQIEIEQQLQPTIKVSTPTKSEPIKDIAITPVKQQEQQYPLLLQLLFEEGKLNPDYFQSSTKTYNQVYSRNGVQILRATGNSLCFRSILSISCMDIDKVFQSLAEIEFVKKWNAVINPNETRILNLIQSENSAIIYERHKPYGMLYLPRDFVYFRYVAYRGNDIIIVDKSIEAEDAPPYLKVIRGEINYQIIEIIKQENDILVRIESEMTNGGLSSTNQDSAITQWYLTELSHLNQFVKTYAAQQTIQSPLLQALKLSKKSFEQAQDQKLPEQKAPEQTIDLPQPSPITTKFEPKFEFIQPIEPQPIKQFTLENLPVIATVPEEIPQQQQQANEVNEIQQYNKEIEEPDLSSYIPSDFIQQTLPELSEDEITQVKRMIKNIEQGTIDYTTNCIRHKYIIEPIPAKDEYIKSIDGGHYFLRQDWKRDMKHGGMIFYNAKKIEAQKRVIKFMLKSIGSNLLSGKSILNISLPVEVFESRSNLERFCYSFTFAPQILEKAAKIDNIAEQMKYTIAFGCSSIIMYMSLEKPFNPILGETYQGFINGCPVFAEQVSHHPPISAFQLKGRGYDIDGHIESAASMHANSVTGKNIGYIRVTYHNTKAKQIFIQCPGVLTGTAFGTRVFNINGRSFTIDLENNLIADMAFNPGSKNVFNKKDLLQDQFIGYVYKVKQGVLNKYRKEGYAKYTGIDFDKDVEQRLYPVNGIWNQMVEFNGEKLFDTFEMNPHIMVNHPCPLPSDSNFRLDILYWKLRDFDNSQRTKEIYEIRQRQDRKWREKLTGKKH